ncbi:MAG: BolA/IbaG family iron-sulfur metabolism protein [Gammaproteobacteria bacterium]|nr:BolA/IbaG family iron-sulfur metabolism protein [Gammaproteobacteria bacterium]
MDMPDFAKMIEDGIEGARASVTGDGSKFEAVVISETFTGLSQVKKHQMVYRIFSAELASGAMHALTIKAYTPSEWEAANR